MHQQRRLGGNHLDEIALQNNRPYRKASEACFMTILKIVFDAVPIARDEVSRSIFSCWKQDLATRKAGGSEMMKQI